MTNFVSLNLWAARITSMVLAGALVFALAYLTWELLLPSGQYAVAPQPVAAERPQVQAQQEVSLAQLKASLARNNPWQQADVVKPSAVEAEPEEEAVASKLDVTLLGTMVGGRDFGWAIVKQGKRPDQLVLQVGDVIEDASVERIERSALYLRNDDRLEVITMAEDALAPVQTNGGQSSSPVPQRRGVAYELTQSRYQELMGRGISLLKGTALNPYSDGDKTLGYQVRLAEESLFREFGFETGDVIESVNQVPVTDSAKMGGLFRSLGQQNEIRVNLIRDGQPREVIVNIR